MLSGSFRDMTFCYEFFKIFHGNLDFKKNFEDFNSVGGFQILPLNSSAQILVVF